MGLVRQLHVDWTFEDKIWEIYCIMVRLTAV